MKNRKAGVGLSISTVVTIAIALIVLVVVASYFMGGVMKSGKGVDEVSSSTNTGTNWSEKMETATEIFAGESGELGTKVSFT